MATAAGEGERELASSGPGELWITLTAPWRPSIAPAWSPDGRFIAVAATTSEGRNRAIVVDSETGSMQGIPLLNGIIFGLGWLNGESLVINQAPQIGSPIQLFRLPYPAGQVTRLTNDPNDYVGASLTADGGGLVTARSEARMDIWVGDAGGITGTDVVRRAPTRFDPLAWSGDRLLYGTISGGRAAIMGIVPGRDGAEEVVLDALTPAVTSDGSTIVFVSSSSEDAFSLWKADASGRRIAKLAPSATAGQVVVTPDDRSVIYTSVVGETASIWTVPLDGGMPTKLVDGAGVSVSPNGRSMAFTDARATLMACDLPGCAAPRTIGSAPFGAPVAWMPDASGVSGVAYAKDGNIWVQSLAGGPPRPLTRFTDNRPIGSFAWSRDGNAWRSRGRRSQTTSSYSRDYGRVPTRPERRAVTTRASSSSPLPPRARLLRPAGREPVKPKANCRVRRKLSNLTAPVSGDRRVSRDNRAPGEVPVRRILLAILACDSRSSLR